MSAAVAEDGYVDLGRAGTTAISGLDGYHDTQHLGRLSYAKVGKKVEVLTDVMAGWNDMGWQSEGVHVVWFKRDLRTRDHEPLQRALQAAAHSGGKVLLLQVFEPGLLAHPTTSSRHVQFQWECGDDIQFTLKQEGWGLTFHRVCAPVLECAGAPAPNRGRGGVAFARRNWSPVDV